MTEDDFLSFLESTASGPTLRELSGSDRAALYLCAYRTGLQLRQLARWRREDLPPDLATELGDWAAKPAGSFLWPGTWAPHVSSLLQRDFKRAGFDGTLTFEDVRTRRLPDCKRTVRAERAAMPQPAVTQTMPQPAAASGDSPLERIARDVAQIAHELRELRQDMKGSARSFPGRLLDVRQVASLLGVSVRTVWLWDATGELRAVRLPGKIVRWNLQDVERVIQAGTARR